ncbi:hypothetical protein E1193_16420 [Micromonospora sp. KC606]|uniref:hypothetical protein n=1 Tax=Micromonospora sp. KC606 TaxID=2530379 RepID=UPI001049B3AE|nr:hypothetical protein [Micromonospora sp. KC606]TDC80868.1 hypothetical protein E1193_16420 [Micromonospora sp. KC606]
MRQPLAKMGAALVLGAILAALVGAGPASAINVRYRAAKSCTVDGKTFRADIHTYGRPTPDGAPAYTEVQLWGFYFESGADVARVEATMAIWRDGGWKWAGPVGVVGGVSSGEWHNGPTPGTSQIGYLTPNTPKAIRVRGYTGGFNYHFCDVILRPADLQWIG